MSSLFAALLGVNPIEQLIAPSGVLHTLASADRIDLTGRQFFPQLISGPFHQGLIVTFGAAAVLAMFAAAASALRGIT